MRYIQDLGRASGRSRRGYWSQQSPITSQIKTSYFIARGHTMYPTVSTHTLQSRRASPSALRWPNSGVSSVLTDIASDCILIIASSRSRSVNLLLLAGKSRRMKEAIKLHPAVMAPSTIKSHLQPSILYRPSRPSSIAPAISPPKAPDRIAAEIYTAKRLLCSAFLSVQIIKISIITSIGLPRLGQFCTYTMRTEEGEHQGRILPRYSQ